MAEAVALGCIPILSHNKAFDSFRNEGLRALSESDGSSVLEIERDVQLSQKIASHNQIVLERFSISSFVKRLDEINGN